MKNKPFGNRWVASPYLLWSLIFIVVPMLMVAYYSFTDANGEFTLANITVLLNYKQVFLISIGYAFLATLISLILAYPLAYIMARMKGASQSIIIILIMLPMWMNFLIRTYSWITILANKGILNQLFEKLGFGPVQMINTPGAVILGMVYNFLPYMILPIYTALAKIDNSLIEAADDLGCNPFKTLKRVILPLSMPGVISGITMVFVPSVSTFYISQKLGGGKTLLIGDVIEMQFQQSYNYNLGASLSLVLMLMILICMAVMNRFADDDGGVIV